MLLEPISAVRRKTDPEPRLPLQGWVTGPVAQSLFESAGLNLEEQRVAAGKPGFKPVSLKGTFGATLSSRIAGKESQNVLALLPGSTHPDEAVIYMGHWDHLGKHEGEGDQIYNGAIDNATGIAGILEIAEQFVTQNPPPARSILFAAVTLEESGLLARSVWVIGKDGTVAYRELVADQTTEPTYDALIAAAQAAAQ